MKLASYKVGSRKSWGVVGADGGVIDLCAEFGNKMPTLRDYLAASDADKARVLEYLGTGFGDQTGKASDFPMSGITLMEPIPDPHAIFCVGLDGVELVELGDLFVGREVFQGGVARGQRERRDERERDGC